MDAKGMNEILHKLLKGVSDMENMKNTPYFNSQDEATKYYERIRNDKYAIVFLLQYAIDEGYTVEIRTNRTQDK